MVCREVLSDVFISYCRDGGTFKARFADLERRSKNTIQRCGVDVRKNAMEMRARLLPELGKRRRDASGGTAADSEHEAMVGSL
jgi:hypothetical protein